MRLGIFAKTFVRPSLAGTLDAIADCGLDCVQFNFACAGLAGLPEKIDPGVVSAAACELKRRNLTVAAVSGTFNMIDPDLARRRVVDHESLAFEHQSKRGANMVVVFDVQDARHVYPL